MATKRTSTRGSVPSARSENRKKLKKYKSRLEARIALRLPTIRDKYEQLDIQFVQPAKRRKYKPDFPVDNNRVIECKGYFDAADRQKHLWIKEQHPELKVYFIFSNKRNRIARSKKTYEDWCHKHGFECISENERIPRHWLGDNNNNENQD